MPNLASQIRVAFAKIASNTGSSSPGELEMTRNTSEVAVCCSRASASSRLSCSSRSERVARIRPTRGLAFVPVERRFSALRDKGYLVGTVIGALPVGLSPRSRVAILTEAHDELAPFLISKGGRPAVTRTAGAEPLLTRGWPDVLV